METETANRTSLAAYGGVIAVAVGLLLAIRATFGYPLFHATAELFGIAVAGGTFMVTWNARRYISNGALIVIGVAFLFSAGVDVLHTLAYRGVNVFPEQSTDLPTQLWLIGRYLQSSAILMAPMFVRRKVSPAVVFYSYAAVTTMLLSSVFVFDIFPQAFSEQHGLTGFKIASEWFIIMLLLVGLVLLSRNKAHFDNDVFYSLAASVVLFVIAEFAFTLYTDPFGTANLVGHLLRVAAFVLIYRAIIETAFVRPYGILFRELSQTAEALNESERRFRSTFEQATLGIAHVSLKGEWLLINKRLAEITGYSIDELNRLRPDEITHPDDLQTENALIERLLTGESDGYRLEKRYLRKDGTTVWVNISRMLVHDEDGAPRYFAAIVEDISARKIAEEHLRRSRDLNAALAVIDRAINSTFDIDEMLRRVVSEGGVALDAESACVTIKRGDVWVARHTWHFPEDIIGEVFGDEDVPHAAEAARLGEPVCVHDAANDGRVNPAAMQRFGIRSVITIPLSFRDQDIGTLYFNYHTRTHRFDSDEMDFAAKLASSLALAIQNARLYSIERDTVDHLQSSLLRIEDDVPGLNVASAYYSATQLTRIGGDFYDLFTLGDGLVAFVIGDVAGKGLEAAAITQTAKSTLRAFAYEWNGEPGKVLTMANRALSCQLEEERFITGIFGIIDTRTGDLRLACAGHPAPIVCGEAACAANEIVRNPPLAVYPDLEFKEYHTALHPGERLVLFSDGLIDARRGTHLLGEEKVQDILVDLGDAPPQIIVRVLLDAAQAHSDGNPPDDIAILAIRYEGPPD